MNAGIEIKSDDWGVERSVCQVGVGPGEGRNFLVMGWTQHSPELLVTAQQLAGDKLHVQGSIALVAHHVIQLLPFTL